MKTNIVLVYKGDALPGYGFKNIERLAKIDNLRIILISNSKNLKEINKNIEIIQIDDFIKDVHFNFSNDIKLRNFRDGFWLKTIERYFVLEAFARVYQIKSFFHIELDNLLFDINGVEEVLDRIGYGMFYPALSNKYCLGSIIYINNLKILKEFCEFVCENKEFMNDMQLLSHFAKKSNSTFILPSEFQICNESSDYKNVIPLNMSNVYFDAASLGQYIFGIDPRNSSRPIFNLFVNENAEIVNKIKKFTYDGSSLHIILKTDRELKVINLHVHSKKFNLIKSNTINKIIDKVNVGEKTLIDLNIVNMIKAIIRRMIRRKLINW